MPTPASISSPIPMLDLARQYAGIRDQVLAAIERVCTSQHFVLGPEVEALEHEIAEFSKAKAAVGCASGTDALWLALAAAGISRGDTVITTPFSFFASASSIVRAGAQPVFVDIAPETLNLDPQKVRHAMQASPTPTSVNENNRGITKAILPVHLYGQCADVDSLQEIANERTHGCDSSRGA